MIPRPPQPRRRSTYAKGNQSAFIYYGLGSFDDAPAIKIGLSRDPRARAKVFGLRILAWYPGTCDTETNLTLRFEAESLGHEWFRPSMRLLCHIATVCNGEPLPPKPPPRKPIEEWIEFGPDFRIKL